MDENILGTKEDRNSNSPNLSSSDTEPLWTVVEVADYLRLEPETIRLMARRGDLPSLKLGKTCVAI